MFGNLRMKTKSHFAVPVIFFLILAIVACSSETNKDKPAREVGSKVQLKGIIACLPKKSEGPVTTECAYGLRVGTAYYGLKNIPSNALKNGVVRTGNAVEVAGTVVKHEDRVYEVKAVIKMETIHLLEEKGKPTAKTYNGRSFRIRYPDGWLHETAANTGWSLISNQTAGEVLVTIKSPKSYLKNTNFGYAQVRVVKNDHKQTVQHCMSLSGSRYKTKKMTINGISFARITTSDAATGDRYLIQSYRTVHNGACWVIESVLNYSPIEFYGNDTDVTEFDQKKVKLKLYNIIQSFKFVGAN